MKYIFIINLFGDINVNIFFIINLVKVDAVSSGTLPIIVLSMPWDGGSTMQAIAVPSSVPQQLRVHSALQATVTGLRPPVPFTNHCDASKRFFFVSLRLVLILCKLETLYWPTSQFGRFSSRISWVLLLTAETLRGLKNLSQVIYFTLRRKKNK
jgi:hypothetical protein